ncbi:hypothetical protein TgHK011_005803 [Trichoderma gracile]|nr:hypothetical protein TgHK011_005803 [Trichoderma gracile]
MTTAPSPPTGGTTSLQLRSTSAGAFGLHGAGHGLVDAEAIPRTYPLRSVDTQKTGNFFSSGHILQFFVCSRSRAERARGGRHCMSSSARAHVWNQRQALIRSLQHPSKQGDAHMGRASPGSSRGFGRFDSQLCGRLDLGGGGRRSC